MRRGRRIAECAWPEVEARVAGGALAVLPIGAASKEHGCHLPLATDWLQAEWLARRLAECRDVLVWPTLGYGYYPVFVDYPGSNSLARETFITVVAEILSGIARAGATCIAVLNTGISTIEPLDQALADPRFRQRARLVNVYSGPRFLAAQQALAEQAWGGHADEIETSLMLAIAPELVDLSRAAPAPVRIERGLFNRTDPTAPNYSPSGVNGDPTRATRSKGERLAAALFEDVLAALDEAVSLRDR